MTTGENMRAQAIVVEEVHKRFTQPRPLSQVLRHPFERKRVQVLSGISLSVPQGSLTGLLGPNGAGKTTLLRILASTIIPDRGQVCILGVDGIRHPARVRENLGVVLGDERSFYWRLTAQQNLRFFAALCNLDRAKADQRIRDLAQVLSLGDELNKPFRNLSTGWRHRLALARALLHDPAVLVMDEPTSGLDPGAAAQARILIRERLVGELGKTVLLATHDLEEAKQICDRVAFLKEGHIQAEGPTASTLSRATEIFDTNLAPAAEVLS